MSVSPALAGPFGFDTTSKQNPADVYSYCEDDGSGFFNVECTNAPKPHPDMKFYLVSFVEGLGVCGIKGISNDISDSNTGYTTQGDTDAIANQIKIKYGSWTNKEDFLLSSSIWDESRDWMMSLIKKDRLYAYVWDLNRPVNGIGSISVGAKALHTDTGYVVAEFLTPDYEKCETAKQNSAADSF